MLRTAFCLIAILSVSTANADWYAGGGAGKVTARDASRTVSQAISQFAGLGVTSNLSYDDQAYGGTILLGYRFTPNLKAEAAYHWLGVYDLTGTFSGGGGAAAGNARDTVSAVSLAGIGSLPINPALSLFAKLGLAVGIDEETCTLSGSSCAAQSDTTTSPLIGAGAEVFFGHNSIRLAYEEIGKIGDKNNEYTAGKFSSVMVEYIFYTQ